ncbi:MAG: prepilin-type N-terminal cleavage/methylation domain-containing protein [Bdellovibrionales bacterium]|nr:prepilin-type N-terminal cleavage/methylation domain-containing protein [Bdellovibrionales bacterium]
MFMSKGFSLVEVLIASVVMLIISGGTVKMFSNLNSRLTQTEQRVGMKDVEKNISSIMDTGGAKILYSKVKELYIREMSLFLKKSKMNQIRLKLT